MDIKPHQPEVCTIPGGPNMYSQFLTHELGNQTLVWLIVPVYFKWSFWWLVLSFWWLVLSSACFLHLLCHSLKKLMHFHFFHPWSLQDKYSLWHLKLLAMSYWGLSRWTVSYFNLIILFVSSFELHDSKALAWIQAISSDDFNHWQNQQKLPSTSLICALPLKIYWI